MSSTKVRYIHCRQIVNLLTYDVQNSEYDNSETSSKSFEEEFSTEVQQEHDEKESPKMYETRYYNKNKQNEEDQQEDKETEGTENNPINLEDMENQVTAEEEQCKTNQSKYFIDCTLNSFLNLIVVDISEEEKRAKIETLQFLYERLQANAKTPWKLIGGECYKEGISEDVLQDWKRFRTAVSISLLYLFILYDVIHIFSLVGYQIVSSRQDSSNFQ